MISMLQNNYMYCGILKIGTPNFGFTMQLKNADGMGNSSAPDKNG